jgi:hypothetical protein
MIARDCPPPEMLNQLAETKLFAPHDSHDAIVGEFLVDAYRQIYGSKYRYVQVCPYMNNHWFWNIVLYLPHNSKVVMPLRSPYKVLASHYRRKGESGWPVMAFYLTQLFLINSLPSVYVLPIDVLETMGISDRRAIVAGFFEDFLEINVTEDVLMIIQSWPRENKGSDELLSDNQNQEIIQRLRNADIYRQLKLIGIDYYDYEKVILENTSSGSSNIGGLY